MLNVGEIQFIAHGNGEAIVGDRMIIGNLERGRAGERDMRVRDVGGVDSNVLRPPLLRRRPRGGESAIK
jgi:hypothetical protein